MYAQNDEVLTVDQQSIDNAEQRRLGNLKSHFCAKYDENDPMGIMVWHDWIVPRIRGSNNRKKVVGAGKKK